ncbi:flavodoxin family protein [Aurantiacibacter luteus]|uniref:Flavodoxin n=1 Tax=Aurantiacibacter luteus TaxID=1581420 RepID=A0A0G9MT88_9SPHN|nr:NAD(P)H-dependent oxidoreductase [Aurantiacibacter luteus]KLE33911.1 flavodoxin [Aurantiacibacter luteus]
MTAATTLLIVSYSRTGASRQLADSAEAWALAVGEIAVRHLDAREAGPEDLLAAAGYLFACPENLAAIAGEMKAFFDRTYYEVLGRIEGRPYAAMICAGSDGENARRQLERICTGWRLRRVADTAIVNLRADTPEAILAPKTVPEPALAQARELGALLAAGLAAGIF